MPIPPDSGKGLDIWGKGLYNTSCCTISDKRRDAMDTEGQFQRFNDLNGEIGAMFHQAAVDAGISDGVQSVLYAILTTSGACTQSQIGRLTGMTRQTVHSATGFLQRQGLAYLDDGKHVCLTEAGMEFAQQKVGPVIAAEKAAFAAWSREDVETLLALTHRYIADFRKNYKR